MCVCVCVHVREWLHMEKSMSLRDSFVSNGDRPLDKALYIRLDRGVKEPKMSGQVLSEQGVPLPGICCLAKQ